VSTAAGCPANSSLFNGFCECNNFYYPSVTMTGTNSATAVLSCVCAASSLNAVVTVANVTKCCPLNATLINGQCGCDSTGVNGTAYYIATSSLGPSANSYLSTPFVCVSTCPVNSYVSPKFG